MIDKARLGGLHLTATAKPEGEAQELASTTDSPIADLTSCMSQLKADCHGKLQLTRTVSSGHPGNDPGARAVDAGISRISRIDVVEDVEGIHPELSVDVLVDRSALHDRQVGIKERRPEVAVALNVAKVIEEGPCERSADRSVGG